MKDEMEELAVCQPQERKGAKNDELDAGETADLLRVDRLKTMFQTDNEYMNLRTLVSGHDDLMRLLNQEKNRLKALFRELSAKLQKSEKTSGSRNSADITDHVWDHGELPQLSLG